MTESPHIFLDGFLDFLSRSPTAWQATKNLETLFLQQGFKQLLEKDPWELIAGGRYFVSRAGSSFAAFILPEDPPKSVTILGTHSDSPALKLKPQAEYIKNNLIMLGTEIYGGPLLNSWLNRDLGLAGRISFLKEDGALDSALVDIKHAPLVIPQLAIHLDRNVNEQGLLLNKQEHLAAIAGQVDEIADLPAKSYLESLLQQEVSFKTLLGHDLFLYPLEKPSYIGRQQEMIAAYRLDNLCSTYIAANALLNQLEPAREHIKLFIAWDNEETGSQSAQGAASPFLPHLLERILLSLKCSREAYLRLLPSSLHISIDLGHALHPNYMEKHEPHHRPLINHGVVLKINAQGRYASSSVTCAKIAHLSALHHIPLQHFVVRSDMPCGSTIGPITAALTGVPTVDIGLPQLSMHASRELVGSKDCLSLLKLLENALT